MNDIKRSKKDDQAAHPALMSMAAQLRTARKAKGLSQRALGKRTGLPQSHISQIENAGADIRTTSLLTLAHALDLELVLIPRKILPVLKSLGGEQSSSSRLVTGTVLNTLQDLKSLETLTARLLSQFDSDEHAEAEIISILHDSLRGLMRFDMTSAQAEGIQDRVRHLQRPLNSLRAIMENKKDVKGAANYYQTLSDVIGTLTPIARDLRDLRNRFVHESDISERRQRPAYRLDNEEEDDG